MRVSAERFRDMLARGERLRSFQLALNAMPTPAVQKTAVLEARRIGRITDDDAELLIQVYQLEVA